VDETMRAMEAEMQSKVRKGGMHDDRRTGEMVYSKFFHRDSRPNNGLSDPHWHVHCFLHNATFDPVEERWKAGQFTGLIADKAYFQEYFHTLLAQKLMGSGTSSGERIEVGTNGRWRASLIERWNYFPKETS
jgi:hypothetical protein